MGMFKADDVAGPNLTHLGQRCCSEWLTTAIRHEPFHNDHLSDRFLQAVPFFHESDGWAGLSERSTSGHLRDVIIIATYTGRLSDGISEAAIGHAKH
eukprot:2002034-Pyramimonas_sp.AAC.1